MEHVLKTHTHARAHSHKRTLTSPQKDSHFVAIVAGTSCLYQFHPGWQVLKPLAAVSHGGQLEGLAQVLVGLPLFFNPFTSAMNHCVLHVLRVKDKQSLSSESEFPGPIGVSTGVPLTRHPDLQGLRGGRNYPAPCWKEVYL